MKIRHTLPFACVAVIAAVARGQAAPPAAESAATADVAVTPVPNEERVRHEFGEVRGDYARLVASALPTDDLTKRLRPLAARVHLRQAEQVLGALRERLREVEAAGRGSEAARSLNEEAAKLESEVRRLRKADDAAAEWPTGWGDRVPGDEVIGRWFERYMELETKHLAATLPTEELERWTGRLRRVVELARAANRLLLIEEWRGPLGGPDAPREGPAEAAVEVTDRAGKLRREVEAVLKTLYDAEVEAEAAGGEVVVEESVTYGKGGGTDLKLDLARPAGAGPFPAVVFIHGGGWHQGNRQAYKAQIRQAAERGYVAATISYRLMKFDQAKKETTTATDPFPAQIHDAKAAVRWLRANSGKYRVDPDRIGVTGGSAGGHLSLLVGLTDPDDGLEGDGGHADQSSRVQAVVNVFGPTDMARCHDTSSVAWIFRLVMGGTPDEAGPTYEKASPVAYVTEDDPPVLTLHGDKDALVPVEQAKFLDEAMKAAGASHTLKVFEGAGHGFGGEHARAANEATWAFFDEHLKPRRETSED